MELRERMQAESRLRRRRGVQNNIIRTLRVHYLSTFDIDKKVEMLQKIRSEERIGRQEQVENSKCKTWILNCKKIVKE